MEVNTIEGRKEFLEQILQGDIVLASGTLLSEQEGQIFETPCDMSTLVKTIGGSSTEVASGTYGTVSRVCIDPECFHQFALKEIRYRKRYGTHENPIAPENIEGEIFKRLSALVLAGITPHVPLYLGDFICLIRGTWYRYFLSEWAAGTLEDLVGILSRPFLWKVLFFQLLYTLATVQKYYPTFRHNDLHIGNVLYFRTPGNGVYEYFVDGISYYLPDIGFRLALWDFDFACMTGTLDNMKTLDALTNPFGMGVEPNHYADMVKFFNYLLVYFRDFLPEETYAWISTFLPEKFRGTDSLDKSPYIGYGGLLYDVELTTPAALLQTAYFEEFRTVPSEETILEIYDDSIDFIFEEVLHTFPIQTTQKFPVPIWHSIKEESKLSSVTYENNYRVFLISKLRSMEEAAFREILLRKRSDDLKREEMDLLMEQLLERFVQDGGILEHANVLAVYARLAFYGMLFLDKAAFYVLHYHIFESLFLSDLLERFTTFSFDLKFILNGMARINRWLQATGLEEEYLRRYRMTPEEIEDL